MKARIKTTLGVIVAVSIVGMVTRNGFAGEGVAGEEVQPAATFKIQYCGPSAAFAPGAFIVITDNGPLLQALQLKWTLPKLSGKDARKQAKHKKAFDALVKKLHDKDVSAEFECSATWAKPRRFMSDFCVISVPQLTKESKGKLQQTGFLPAAKK